MHHSTVHSTPEIGHRDKALWVVADGDAKDETGKVVYVAPGHGGQVGHILVGLEISLSGSPNDW